MTQVPLEKEADAQVNVDQSHEPVTADLLHLVKDAGQLFAGTFDLVALEARLAALSFAWLLALSICLSITIISIWTLLAIALAFWLASNGYETIATLLTIALANLVLCCLLWLCIRKLCQNLTFSTTRGHLFKNNKSTTTHVSP